MATEAAAATVEFFSNAINVLPSGATEHGRLRQNDLGGGLHEVQSQRTAGFSLAKRHGVDAGSQRFAHEAAVYSSNR